MTEKTTSDPAFDAAVAEVLDPLGLVAEFTRDADAVTVELSWSPDYADITIDEFFLEENETPEWLDTTVPVRVALGEDTVEGWQDDLTVDLENTLDEEWDEEWIAVASTLRRLVGTHYGVEPLDVRLSNHVYTDAEFDALLEVVRDRDLSVLHLGVDRVLGPVGLTCDVSVREGLLIVQTDWFAQEGVLPDDLPGLLEPALAEGLRLGHGSGVQNILIVAP